MIYDPIPQCCIVALFVNKPISMFNTFRYATFDAEIVKQNSPVQTLFKQFREWQIITTPVLKNSDSIYNFIFVIRFIFSNHTERLTYSLSAHRSFSQICKICFYLTEKIWIIIFIIFLTHRFYYILLTYKYWLCRLSHIVNINIGLQFPPWI